MIGLATCSIMLELRVTPLLELQVRWAKHQYVWTCYKTTELVDFISVFDLPRAWFLELGLKRLKPCASLA